MSFKTVGTSCYLLQHTGESWQDAKMSCEALGAHLVKIDAQGEANALLQEISESYAMSDGKNSI